MDLVSVLAAGVRGAENGSATIYARGTTQRVTYYSDFEATQPKTATLTLDANGRAVAYVNQLVDVRVADSDGVAVLSFTAGHAAPAVEVISPSFTGTSYTSGASGTSKPTTLQRVLDSWEENSGAPDWKVLISGSATTLETFAAAVSGMVFNVKTPAYGALGNGVADDTSAIQAAITAAAAGGGTVYFPPGNYRVTAALTLGYQVCLLGAGPAASIISMDSAGEDTIQITSTSLTGGCKISQLSFQTSQANSGDFVTSSVDDVHVTISDVWFRPGASHTGVCVSATLAAGNGNYFLDRVVFRLRNGSSAVAIALATLRASMCRLESVDATLTPFTGSLWNMDEGVVVGCTWDLANVTAGGGNVLSFQPGTGQGLLVGCAFTVGAGYTAQLRLDTVIEWANRFSETGTWSFVMPADAAAATFAQCGANSIEAILRTGTNAGAAHTIPDDSGTYVLTSIATSGFTVTLPTWANKRKLKVVIHNNDGTNRAVTWDGGATTVRPAGTPTVNANTFSIFEFQCMRINGANTWLYATTLANSAE